MSKVFNTRIALRRNNDYNYDPQFIPLKGEVCLVDTASQGLQLKIGDGSTSFQLLDYWNVNDDESPIKFGYLHDNVFYTDDTMEHVIEANEDWLYVDVWTSCGYFYYGGQYRLIQSPRASSVVPGIMKLYATTGQNEDGTMTQKAITDELDAKNAEVQGECLIISL